ncbi:MAG: DUF4831 family protein [Paludibacteraceae bacterium]|nr:DUF4831 family protein [Paludibacteraceae bacterium]
MKKVFLMLLGAMMVCAAQAQIVAQDEAAVVYYSPKTSISLDFTYTVETYERGIYAQYAEAMLGIDDVVKQNKTSYRLDNARINTSTSVDYERAHKITADAGFPMLLTINEKGLLVGYNYTPDNKPAPRPAPHHPQEPKPADAPMPLPEEVLTATTPQAQAFAAAKQIFHIRETRMYLLSGEVEHAPADGLSMQLVLAELDKQEQALIELFVGKKTTQQLHKRFTIVPGKEEELFFFSEENGFTDGENVDADTIRVSMAAVRQQLAVPQETNKKKKAPELSQLVYNLPGSCEVQVSYKGNQLAQRTIAVAQFGVDVPFAKDIFTGTLPVIVFSEKTGNIQSITK